MMLVNCHRCGHPNEPGEEFCEQCGVRAGVGMWDGPSSPPPPREVYAPPTGASAGASGAAFVPAYAAGEQPEGGLPVDFAFAPFEGVRDVVGPTLRVYRENFLTLGKIVLVVALAQLGVTYALSYLSGGAGDDFVQTAMVYLIDPLMAAVIIHAVITIERTGRSPSLLESYAWGLRKWVKVILCTLLVSLAAAVGLALLIVPGVIIMLMLAVAVPVVVVEDTGVGESLSRSAELTKGYRWLILGTQIVLWLLIMGVTYLTGGFEPRGPALGTPFFVMLIHTVLRDMLSSAFTVLSLFIYLGIRADRGEIPSTVGARAAATAAG